MSTRPRRRQQTAGGAGTVFFLVGCLTVLGATFGVGLYVGRYSAAAPIKPPSDVSARGTRPAAPESGPRLTFYQELTAPLTASPPPPKAWREPARRPEPPAVTGGDGAPVTRDATLLAEGRTFTVQVAAYTAKPPAETLRATLTAAGHDAYLAETEAGGGRYRVRVGRFSNRADADAAAARLRNDFRLPTFVTVR